MLLRIRHQRKCAAFCRRFSKRQMVTLGSTTGAVPRCCVSVLIVVLCLFSGWLENAAATSVCSWHGVTCRAGVVIGINLSLNNLTGRLPPEIGSLTTLETLILQRNAMRGAIPPTLGNLVRLKSLWLRVNMFTGSIPSELGNLQNLQFLLLNGNMLTGQLPPSLCNLKRVRHFRVEENMLSGLVPACFGDLSHLEVLMFFSNNLIGPLPTTLSNLQNLTVLEASYNNINSTIPTIASPNLQSLGLEACNFFGSLPAFIGTLKHLRFLWLGVNKLSVVARAGRV